MNTLNQTGIPEKKIGDGLSAAEVNTINTTINQAVEVSNSFLRSFCNLNQESGDYSKTYTLSSAINSVPESRRNPGMMIRFLDKDGKYEQFIFIGSDVKDWQTTNLWQPTVKSIDGGEW